MSLGADLVVGVMAQQRPRDIAWVFPATSNLNSKISVELSGLVRDHLNAIHLHNGAWKSPPSFRIVHGHHSLLRSQRAGAQGSSVRFSFESSFYTGIQDRETLTAIVPVRSRGGYGFDASFGGMTEHQSRGKERGR